jgi:hypothetical protein
MEWEQWGERAGAWNGNSGEDREWNGNSGEGGIGVDDVLPLLRRSDTGAPKARACIPGLRLDVRD